MPPNTIDDSPPSYHDAIIQGVLERSGRTPFPDAPRLAIRDLDLQNTLRPLFPLPAKSKLVAPVKPLSKLSKEDHHLTDVKILKFRAPSSGWQSDTSYVSSSKQSLGSKTKKKVIVTSPLSSNSSTSTSTDDVVCKLQPLLAYHPSRPSLLLDFSKPASRMRLSGDVPVPIRESDLDQHATKPPTTSLHIATTQASWTIHVRKKTGVTYRDVLTKLRDHLYNTISQEEWDQVRQPYRDRVKQAYHRRCKASDVLYEVEQRKGIRRVDLLCESVIWKGLSPSPDQPNHWILTLGRH